MPANKSFKRVARSVVSWLWLLLGVESVSAVLVVVVAAVEAVEVV